MLTGQWPHIHVILNEPSTLENLKWVKLSSDFLRVLLGIQSKEQLDTRHPVYLCGVEMTRRCRLSWLHGGAGKVTQVGRGGSGKAALPTLSLCHQHLAEANQGVKEHCNVLYLFLSRDTKLCLLLRLQFDECTHLGSIFPSLSYIATPHFIA